MNKCNLTKFLTWVHWKNYILKADIQVWSELSIKYWYSSNTVLVYFIHIILFLAYTQLGYTAYPYYQYNMLEWAIILGIIQIHFLQYRIDITKNSLCDFTLYDIRNLNYILPNKKCVLINLPNPKRNNVFLHF